MQAEDIQSKFSDILSLLNGVTQKGNEYHAFCPSCENNKTSRDAHLYLKIANEKILLDCKKGCSADEICSALGKTTADLFENKEKPQPWVYLREHIYYDVQGNIFAKKVIYRKPDNSKTGIWQRYEQGQYKKSLNGNKPPMYNLPLLASTRDGDYIFIVEGEKDADTLCSMKYIATTAPNGAGQAKIPDDCIEYFRGRDIVIMGDNDEPGRKYAEILYNTLRKIGRQVVKVEPAALWDKLPEKGDVSDVYQVLGEDETRTRIDAAVTAAFAADLYLRPYIFMDGEKHKISPPSLHKFIRTHENYIFARSDAKGSVQRYIYRDGVYRNVSDDEFKGSIRSYLPVPLHSTRTINEVFNLFSMDADRFIQIDDLDSDESIINFRNGILYLHSMKLIPHSPEHLSTIQIPVVYNPEAAKPCNSVFERFIEHLTEGDSNRRQLILEFMGASLSNVAGYRMKKALFMYGVGNTGKSQCKELLIRLLGAGRYSGIDLDALEERFGTSQLYGKRLAGSSDMGYVTVKGLRVIKLLTGGDSVFAEFKGENAFTYKFKGILWFCANRMPRFGGDKGDHVYERIMILPCNNIVANPDPKLLDKMFYEKEYIVRICVEAVKQLIDNNYRYTEPECSRDEMKSYRIENDSVLQFLCDCTEPRNPDVKFDENFTTSRIYRMYKNWCFINNGGYPETRDIFNITLKAAGITERILHGNNYYSILPTKAAVLEYDITNG